MDKPISDELLPIMLSSAVDTLDELQSQELAVEAYVPYVPTVQLALEAFEAAVQREWAPHTLIDAAQVLLMALQAGEANEQVRILARDTRALDPVRFCDPDSDHGG